MNGLIEKAKTTYKHNSTVNDKLWVFTSTKSLDPFKLNYNIQDIIVKYDLLITLFIIISAIFFTRYKKL